jgi:hypothetical protein
MGERQGHERSEEPGRRIARRGVLKAGLVAGALGGTGAWRADHARRELLAHRDVLRVLLGLMAVVRLDEAVAGQCPRCADGGG